MASPLTAALRHASRIRVNARNAVAAIAVQSVPDVLTRGVTPGIAANHGRAAACPGQPPGTGSGLIRTSSGLACGSSQ